MISYNLDFSFYLDWTEWKIPNKIQTKSEFYVFLWKQDENCHLLHY